MSREEKQGNHYRNDDGTCNAISCSDEAIFTVITRKMYPENEVWIHRADYCRRDAMSFTFNFARYKDTEVVGVVPIDKEKVDAREWFDAR